MPELARCQCANGGGPPFDCTAVATAEDLLCDDCREGCNFGIAGQPHMRLPFKPVLNIKTGPVPRYEQGTEPVKPDRLERSRGGRASL